MFTGIYSSEDHLEREFETGSTVCDLSVNKIFSVLAGLISFWIPAVVIVYVYARSGHELNFFLFPFCKKSLKRPLIGETLFSSVPHSNSWSPSQTLEGLFELTRRHSRALALPRALLQRYKTTVRCVTLGAEVPGHRQKWLTKP